MAAEAARSGNPAVRALAASDEPLEHEAADEPYSFEFGGETWELIDDFNILEMTEYLEANRPVGGLRYALGDQYDDFKKACGRDVESMNEAIDALVNAVGLGTPGNSRASRRSSAKRRPARR